MRRYILPIILLFVLTVACLFLILNTPFVSAVAIPHFVQSFVPGVNVSSFRIGWQRYRFPDTIILSDVSCVLAQDGRDVQMRIGKVILDEMLDFLKARDQLRLTAEDLSWSSGPMSAEGLRLKILLTLGEDSVQKFDGIFAAKAYRRAPYTFRDISARIKGEKHKAEVYELSARLYNGRAQGQISFLWEPLETAVLWLEFSDMDPATTHEVFGGLLSRVHGRLNGTCRLITLPQKIDLLAVSLSMPSGGNLGPTLAEKLLEITDDRDKRQLLEDQTRLGGGLDVDEANLHVQSSNGNRLVFMYSLSNGGTGLKLKETYAREFEEGLFPVIFQMPPGPGID